MNRRLVAAALPALILAGAARAQGPAAPAPAPAPAPVAAAPLDPARLAAGERVAALLVPEGAYPRIMRDQLPKIMDAMLAQMNGMSVTDLSGGTVRDATPTMAEARRADPHLDERMRITMRVMGEEMGALMGRLEPRVRAGLGRALARRFTVSQLADLVAFFATPTGAAFARDYLALMADPELISEMAAATPEIMRAMPAIMEKTDAATKHLPPAPRRRDGEGDDE